MYTSKVVNSDGSIEIYFVKLGHWDDFDLILGLLQQENGCQIRSNEEMIYIRQAKLLWHNIDFGATTLETAQSSNGSSHGSGL
jgi:hypothetical protein